MDELRGRVATIQRQRGPGSRNDTLTLITDRDGTARVRGVLPRVALGVELAVHGQWRQGRGGWFFAVARAAVVGPPREADVERFLVATVPSVGPRRAAAIVRALGA
ncbi:MAG: hypothetical protein ACYDAG_10910, partial [Chloroflexota bacterium]